MLRRALLVTLGLAAVGAAAGGACAACVFVALAASLGGLDLLGHHHWAPWIADAAALGAAVGAVGAPSLAWGLLRRVPLGRALAETAAGTLLGAAAGALLGFDPLAPSLGAVLGGSVAGFVLAGVRLRLAPPPRGPARLPAA